MSSFDLKLVKERSKTISADSNLHTDFASVNWAPVAFAPVADFAPVIA